MTIKPSICTGSTFYKSSVYAVTVSCLTPGDLPGASTTRLGAEQSALNPVEKSANGIVGKRQAKLLRHSRPKGGATDRPSRKAGD